MQYGNAKFLIIISTTYAAFISQHGDQSCAQNETKKNDTDFYSADWCDSWKSRQHSFPLDFIAQCFIYHRRRDAWLSVAEKRKMQITQRLKKKKIPWAIAIGLRHRLHATIKNIEKTSFVLFLFAVWSLLFSTKQLQVCARRKAFFFFIFIEIFSFLLVALAEHSWLKTAQDDKREKAFSMCNQTGQVTSVPVNEEAKYIFISLGKRDNYSKLFWRRTAERIS